MNSDELRASWNKIAPEFHKKLARPIDDVCYGRFSPTERTLNLLGNVSGKQILDLGCGAGQNCAALTKMGAICIGVDISEEQIRWANLLAEQEGLKIDFHCNEILEYVSAVPANTFDVILSVMCLPYLIDLSAVFLHAFRILRSSGAM